MRQDCAIYGSLIDMSFDEPFLEWGINYISHERKTNTGLTLQRYNVYYAPIGHNVFKEITEYVSKDSIETLAKRESCAASDVCTSVYMTCIKNVNSILNKLNGYILVEASYRDIETIDCDYSGCLNLYHVYISKRLYHIVNGKISNIDVGKYNIVTIDSKKYRLMRENDNEWVMTPCDDCNDE